MTVFQKARRLDPRVRYPDQRRRFLARVEIDFDTGCWRWQGHRDWRGYGRLERRHAHRIGYELFIGDIPIGLHLDHLCANTSCVYYGHLEAVTQAENNRRQWARRGRATACRRGHGYATYGHRNPQGYMVCNECARLRTAEKRTARA